MDVDFTRLSYFLAVAEEKHFKRAADRLRISAPPLSQQIKLLEAELGGPLFERGYRSVSLTTLGEALVEPARDILDRVEQLKAVVARMTGAPTRVRFGATAYASSEYLDLAQSVVEKRTVGFDVFVIPGSSAEVIAQLAAGHLELGLIHNTAADDRVDMVPAIRFRNAIAVRGDDPLARKPSVRLDDFRDREISIETARPNPQVFASTAERFAGFGFTRVIKNSSATRSSELELAAQIKARKLVALVPYSPRSTIGRIFSPPEFALIPIEDPAWAVGTLAVAWSRARAKSNPELIELAHELARAIKREDV